MTVGLDVLVYTPKKKINLTAVEYMNGKIAEVQDNDVKLSIMISYLLIISKQNKSRYFIKVRITVTASGEVDIPS